MIIWNIWTYKQHCNSMWLKEATLLLVTKSCLTLCDSVDCSPPGFSVHGISQARILEWLAISFSRESPEPVIEPMCPALQVDSLPGKTKRGNGLLKM